MNPLNFALSSGKPYEQKKENVTRYHKEDLTVTQSNTL